MTILLSLSTFILLAIAFAGLFSYNRAVIKHNIHALAHVALAFLWTIGIELLAITASRDETLNFQLAVVFVNLIGIGAMAALVTRFTKRAKGIPPKER